MKTIFLCGSISILAASAYIFFHEQGSREPRQPPSSTQADLRPSSASAPAELELNATPDNVHCKVDNPLFNKARFTPLHPDVIESKLKTAYSDPASVIDDLAKSPESSIALFQLVSSCFPGILKANSPGIQLEGCPAIDIKKIITLHPIEILEKSAEQGSVDAKILYMINAQGAAAQLRRLGTVAGDELAREITLRSQRYGEEAARAGSEDALRYMSSAYEQGRFGIRSMQMAYTFALPLIIGGTSSDVQHASDLGARLTEPQRKEAQTAALGCSQPPKAGILNNPFG